MYLATDPGHGPPDLPRQPAPRRPTTQPEPAKCPRCASPNTKFCYYNNYNKSQPRHFCKSCKRHWTKGGTLRNVPVGGARSKNKRPKIPKPAAKPATSSILYRALIGGAHLPRGQMDIGPNATKPATAPASGEHKGTSSILYRALIGGAHLPRGQMDNGPNAAADDQFQFSSLSAFEITSPPLNPVEYRYNLDSTEDSCKNNIPSSSHGSWPGPDATGSCFDLLPNYWNWSEIEASSADHHINIPWDEVKP